ncbi:MAG TPA: D-Ala-D-Ala carboxypeptidase family metallohydrolase [Planctomycetota bacterium]|nr:D-Ala-D-Ala carboxypeptidase family metallohydrolase [Planctomycetota bacterium]
MQLQLVNSVRAIPRKVWLIAGGAAAFLFAMWMLSLLFHRSSSSASSPSLSQPAATTMNEWQIELLGNNLGGAPQFAGTHPLNKPLFVPPGADFSVAAQPAEIGGAFDESSVVMWLQNGGRISTDPSAARQILHTPRQPGLYHLTWNSSPNEPRAQRSGNLAPASSSSELQPPLALDILVLAEAEISAKGDRTLLSVNGKSIGGYLDPTKSTSKLVREHAGLYQVPRFFAQLTPETAKLRLGPDFELGQLIAFKDYTDKDGHKVFTTERHTDVLPLRMELIDKLVKLRERLRQKGVKVTRFAVTSGFRTPDYNRQIHGAAYSRHCYGDGIDIYIDENNDHHMDDLNGDGKLDRKDGLIIANACRELELEGAVVPGGIGLYEWSGDESVRSHVHIDCRGFISRWGLIDNKRAFTWWPPEEFQGEAGE